MNLLLLVVFYGIKGWSLLLQKRGFVSDANHKNAPGDDYSNLKAAADQIVWEKPYDQVLDRSNAPLYRWFKGGLLNTCYNAVDRHVNEGRGAQTALIYDSAMTGAKRQFTYAELQDQVARTAGMLAAHNVQKGDRVVIYMPMIPETVFAMLACARIGAVHSVVFGGFAADELAKRIDDAQPKLILSASCGLEPGRTVQYKPLLDRAIEKSAHKPEACIIFQRPECLAELASNRDHDWAQALSIAEPAPCTPVAATDPLYILYTSGTTGVPKGVVRDNGGHAVALKQTMTDVYDTKPGEVFWAASDVGWVVGHSYIVYAPLFHGCTTILYEGKPIGTPDAGAFWRVIEEYKVNTLFTAPTAFRAIRREDPSGALISDYDISSLRALFLAGERADPDTLQWAEEQLRIPVIDHWWQTELGYPALAVSLGKGERETRHGSAGKPVGGFNVQVLDHNHNEVPRGTTGDIAIKLPLPPGGLPTLWRNDDGYRDAYLSAHPGYYTTGDSGFQDTDDFVHVMSRTDDIINIAGHRLATGAIEQVIAAHTDVAECAVIGAADTLKGAVPVALMVLNAGVSKPESEVISEVIQKVRNDIGPVAAFKTAAVVKALPKTRSGKVLRKTIRKIADGEDYDPPATIEDPAALDIAKQGLKSVGLAKD